MKDEIYNEQELQKLEEEIRAMGIPYSADEPDERYFANFRVRLMERIEEKEAKRTAFASVWSWIVSSPVRGLSLGAGLAAVVIAVLFVKTSPDVPVANLESPAKIDAPAALPAPKEIPQLSQGSKPSVTKPAEQPTKDLAVTKQPTKNFGSIKQSKDIAPKNLASATLTSKEKLDTIFAEAPVEGLAMTNAVVAGGESGEPVDLESLSAPELESVLSAVESMK
jgi:hypothetical protein